VERGRERGGVGERVGLGREDFVAVQPCMRLAVGLIILLHRGSSAILNRASHGATVFTARHGGILSSVVKLKGGCRR